MVEPRRLATKAAARRMAAMLDEKVGSRVGYRVRLESRVSSSTRVVVMTYGYFLRCLQQVRPCTAPAGGGGGVCPSPTLASSAV